MKTVMMVEGRDDEHVVKSLCGIHNLGIIDIIKDYGGDEKLLATIPVRIKESDVRAVGIVMDADVDVGSRWEAIKNRLTQFGYDLPSVPHAGGTILPAQPEAQLPKVGIWIMPNNIVPGILEDFIKFLVPADDALIGYADKCIDEISAGHAKFAALRRPKALIHTWLAWQEEPGKPFGQAITAKFLDANVPQATTFRTWLSDTFFAK